MAKGRLLVVVNLHASRAGESLGDAVAFLTARGFDLDIRQSADRESLANLIRDCAVSVDAIVVAGGDGTVNGALPALIEARKPVGILPFGTANDLALTLGIPAEPLAAAAVIAGGRTRRIDVGKVNDVYFLNVASIGLSVEITERQDAELKRQLGVLSYLLTALRTLGGARPFDVVIEHDGVRHAIEAFQVAVGNGVHYGGGMRVAESAAIDDGMLDVYAIATASIPELIALGPRLIDGTLGTHDKVTTFRAASLHIDTGKRMPVNTDGEITTETPAAFSVVRGALEVFAPAD